MHRVKRNYRIQYVILIGLEEYPRTIDQAGFNVRDAENRLQQKMQLEGPDEKIVIKSTRLL